MRDEKIKFEKNNQDDGSFIFWVTVIILVSLILLLASTGKSYVVGAIVLNASVLVFLVLNRLIGYCKANQKKYMDKKYINETNPYIYYRELPNNYGIGITSILFDSTIEKQKDIIAVILDLCAKKYLKIIKQDDKYIIKVLKPSDDNLLNNEKYILINITKHTINLIDYQAWYDLCFQDGEILLLYLKPNNELDNPNQLKIIIKIAKLIGVFLFPCAFIVEFIGNRIKWLSMVTSILLLAMLAMGFAFVGLLLRTAIYNKVHKNILRRTTKGIDELHKLQSFRAFLADFGNFVDKNPEEVELWDRYLAYAQVFGLTKQIMKTGYKQLVENSSFSIDDIDKINLDNIEIIE